MLWGSQMSHMKRSQVGILADSWQTAGIQHQVGEGKRCQMAQRYQVTSSWSSSLDPRHHDVETCHFHCALFECLTHRIHEHSEKKMKSLSCVRLFVSPWTIAYQASLSMGFPGKNIGVGCHFLLQGIFPTQGSNPGLQHCRQVLYPLSHQRSPKHSKVVVLYTKFGAICFAAVVMRTVTL